MVSHFAQGSMKKKLWVMMLSLTSIITFPLIASSFEIQPLPIALKTRMIEVETWKPSCPVEIDRLRLVQFTHYDFSGHQQQGQMVVLEAVAERVLNIFKALHHYQFPIAQAKTMEEYLGQDKPSMAANNSSAFNYRPVAGKTFLSVHSYGVAIDINPIQNPCLEPKTIIDSEEVLIPVQPAEGQGYLNRTNVRAGMVEQVLEPIRGLRVVELFKQNGFYVWGGKWNDPVDWQHFQPSRAAAEWLAFMSPEDAKIMFEIYISKPALLNDAAIRTFDFKTLYSRDPQRFMQALHSPKFLEMSPQEAYNSLSELM
ncbi:MAG: M15 family metallopeptidase [Parachlamydiaceae bacterium]|nr:M15 family metallopeptidase [Parachlamydiaceae bacterium]